MTLENWVESAAAVTYGIFTACGYWLGKAHGRNEAPPPPPADPRSIDDAPPPPRHLS